MHLGQTVGVEVQLFQVHSFRRSYFSNWLGKRASSSSWLRSRRSPTGRTAATCRTISSRSVHLSGTGLLLIVRTVVASPFAIKMYSQNFIRKTTNIPNTILSSAFVRSVNGPTRHHNLSPNTHLPMKCPRPRHRFFFDVNQPTHTSNELDDHRKVQGAQQRTFAEREHSRERQCFSSWTCSLCCL